VSDSLIDFATFQRSGKPNQCLALPPGFTSASRPDLQSPVFRTMPRLLRDAFDAAVAGEPRLHLVEETPDRLQLHLVQRSRWFGFPDDVTVAFIAMDALRSSLAVWSRARHGHLDFGVNRSRVRRWLDRLTDLQRHSLDGGRASA
jgi:uncharacterized protein (DUF1499 family)